MCGVAENHNAPSGREGARSSIWELDIVITDRSGIDPLMYARMFCGDEASTNLTDGEDWQLLKVNMTAGIIVVCPPIQEWLTDDGVRLMPLDWAEWLAMHELFCRSLDEHRIPYVTIPPTMTNIDERVKFVVQFCSLD